MRMDIFSFRKLLNRQVFTLCDRTFRGTQTKFDGDHFFMKWPFIYHSIPEFQMYSAHHFAPFCNLDYPQCHFYYVLKGAVRNVETHGKPVFVGT